MNPSAAADSLANLVGRARRIAGRAPLGFAWLVAFAAFLVAGCSGVDLPPYHDALTQWDEALRFERRPSFPFVVELDVGHPPLAAYALALAWRLGLPRLLAMHLLGWAAAALFVSATFAIGRRAFGAATGFMAALLVFSHPVVAAQALQFNLDLPYCAFAMLALLGATEGRPARLAVGCTGASLLKLNGMFALAPFLAWAALRLVNEGTWRRPRLVLAALWPPGVALVAFAIYHAIKLPLTGHLFVTREFLAANLRFVDGPAEYGSRLAHALRQAFGFNNGNDWALAGLALLVLAISVGPPGALARLWSHEGEAVAGGPAHGFWQPLGPKATLALLWMMALLSILLWSLRRYPALVRYFLIVYPALHLTFAAVALRCVRSRAVGYGVSIVLVALLLVRWHPRRAAPLPAAIGFAFVYPPDGVSTNYENNLEFADQVEMMRGIAARLEVDFPDHPGIEADWPFDVYLSQPLLGMVSRPFPIVRTAAPLILVTSRDHPVATPAAVPVRAGYRVHAVEQSGRVWMETLHRN